MLFSIILLGKALSMSIMSKCSFIELSETIVNLVRNSSTIYT